MTTTAGDVVRTALRGVGQTLITVGVVLLLFCVYELWVTNLVTAQEQAGVPRKQAIPDVARRAGVPKRVVYDAVHKPAPGAGA